MIVMLTSRIMTRTTIDLDALVLEQLRRRAAVEHKSMGQVASERLAVGLSEDAQQPTPLHWPTKRMGRPNVDLQDKDAVWKSLDG